MAMFDFLGLRDTVGKIGASIRELRATIETKKQERENLLHAPLPRKELADQLCGMVDRRASVYPKRLAAALAGIANKPMYDFDASQIDIVGTFGAHSNQNVVPKDNLMWFFGDLIKQRIRDAVDVMDWDDENAGPSRAERKQRIVKLDKEIADLEKQEAEFIEQARQAGITL